MALSAGSHENFFLSLCISNGLRGLRGGSGQYLAFPLRRRRERRRRFRHRVSGLCLWNWGAPFC